MKSSIIYLCYPVQGIVGKLNMLLRKLEKVLSTHTFIRRGIIFFSLVLLGWIDLNTGFEYAFSVFYLVPVSIAAWYDTVRSSIITILVSVLTWLYADFGAGHYYSSFFVPFWNGCVRFGFFGIVAMLLIKVRRNLATLTTMAMQDTLTGLNNLRAFNFEYQLLHKISLRKGMQFAVAMIDLDGFKAVNDQWGHSTGDEVLIQFAQILKQSSRSSDILARLGGDEFVIILIDTDAAGAEQYSNKLREIFLESGLKQKYGVDFSMGIRISNTLPENCDEATHQADQLMYQSKALGKSRTTICFT